MITKQEMITTVFNGVAGDEKQATILLKQSDDSLENTLDLLLSYTKDSNAGVEENTLMLQRNFTDGTFWINGHQINERIREEVIKFLSF